MLTMTSENLSLQTRVIVYRTRASHDRGQRRQKLLRPLERPRRIQSGVKRCRSADQGMNVASSRRCCGVANGFGHARGKVSGQENLNIKISTGDAGSSRPVLQDEGGGNSRLPRPPIAAKKMRHQPMAQGRHDLMLILYSAAE